MARRRVLPSVNEHVGVFRGNFAIIAINRQYMRGVCSGRKCTKNFHPSTQRLSADESWVDLDKYITQVKNIEVKLTQRRCHHHSRQSVTSLSPSLDAYSDS